ncbi:hypothetical protein [Rhodococcus erythropolis]|uniref:hypothetical protein n=1 Tax=Rhodococcus erythropolis TaxID=1833 RepID=UPI001113C3FE|nr:hypothetical protein [Rhodococcus erythropolis]
MVNVVVRHPEHEEARQFDASQEELKALKTVGNLVSLELRFANGTSQDVFAAAVEFAKLVPAEKLTTFDLNRTGESGDLLI